MIYFDNAATSYPKPQAVYDAISDAYRDYGANPGRSGHKMALATSRAIFEVREKVIRFLGGENPLQVIFGYNCTDCLNMGIHGLVKYGDHVVSTSMEHNSVLRPLKMLENNGVDVTIVEAGPDGVVRAEDMAKVITPETNLVVMGHISNLTGSIQPIEEVAKIAHERGALFMVDAAQSAGVYPIDLKTMGIDCLAAPGHKSLYGPTGTGFLWSREDCDIRPLKQGGTGSVSNSVEQPELMPDKLESGTLNAPGIVGLGAGIDFINKTGMDVIRKKEEDLAFYFIEELSKIPGYKIYGPKERGKQAPVVPINLRDVDSSELAFVLDDQYDIAVRPGLHCAPLAHKTIGTFDQGVVRFSFGYENTMDEVETALKALREIADGIL